MSSHHLHCVWKLSVHHSLLACFSFLFVFINVWVLYNINMVSVVPIFSTLLVFCHLFFSSPISRLENPSDLQNSLRICLSFLCYGYSNKLIHWIVQFQISGKLQVKMFHLVLLKYFYVFVRNSSLFVLCEFISRYVIESACSSCFEALASQCQHVIVFTLELLCVLHYFGFTLGMINSSILLLYASKTLGDPDCKPPGGGAVQFYHFCWATWSASGMMVHSDMWAVYEFGVLSRISYFSEQTPHAPW